MVTTRGLFPIDWGMFHLSLEGDLFLMRLVICLVWVLIRADLKIGQEVRSGWS